MVYLIRGIVMETPALTLASGSNTSSRPQQEITHPDCHCMYSEFPEHWESRNTPAKTMARLQLTFDGQGSQDTHIGPHCN